MPPLRSRRVPRSTGSTTASIGLPAVLLLLAVGAPAGSQPAGSIDLAAANRIVDGYARHVMSSLPRAWRKAEEEKMRTDPPRIDGGGVFQILAPGGHIAFEYDADNLLLHADAKIHKMRREMSNWGLDWRGIKAALDKAVAAGAPTGGGEVHWDPVAKGFFLRRTYAREPAGTRQLVRELDRLLATGEKWFRKHYLEAVQAHVATLAPPASATGRDGDLELTIVLTNDKRYQDLWRKPPGGSQPRLVSLRDFSPGQEVWALALFRGARPDETGLLRYQAQYTFVYPDGAAHASPVGNLWWSEPPPADHLQMSELRAAIDVDETTPPGDYVAAVKACDAASDRCLTAQTPFRVIAGPAR